MKYLNEYTYWHKLSVGVSEKVVSERRQPFRDETMQMKEYDAKARQALSLAKKYSHPSRDAFTSWDNPQPYDTERMIGNIGDNGNRRRSDD